MDKPQLTQCLWHQLQQVPWTLPAIDLQEQPEQFVERVKKTVGDHIITWRAWWEVHNNKGERQNWEYFPSLYGVQKWP